MEISSPMIKKFLIYSQKKAFLIFPEMERFKKLPIFQEQTFPAQKNKKPTLKEFLIYQEMKLSGPKLLYFHIFIILLYFQKTFICFSKDFLYFRRKLTKTQA